MNNQTNDRKTSQLLANLNKRALMLVEIMNMLEKTLIKKKLTC